MFISRARRKEQGLFLSQWMIRAKELWVMECQKDLILDQKFKDWKHQFHLFQDNRGVWRCGGRLHNADLPYNALYPILLPSTHYFTQLVVRRAHFRVGHNGVKETLTELRTRYWIIKG